MKKYLSLDESLSQPGADLVARDLKAELKAGTISLVEYLHLKEEQRLTKERRDLHRRLPGLTAQYSS